MFGRKKVLELEQLLESLQMNSSNNYKDAAKKDYETFWRHLKKLKESGSITEKTAQFYEREGNKWQGKMKNYHHQNNVRAY